ncbi:dicarboxylate/amino acid:cation symporter [Agromyces mediolanus]|uniref:dicarboxylate/amino acid:cation symporter n=1 Tax=Agromyces mediolanus TaxID=41986 RepID=UPI00203E9566|nr:cation:dicarboxylase symporter family transporter [Agromyces mediolanus]MCM3657950.1 dicarboxylate/amino acid:cation symporter [Agromyces mediolanus]
MAEPDWLALAATGVVAALFVGLFLLRRRGAGFTLLTVVALVVGVAAGLAFQGHLAYVDVIGTIYINVITAFVAPLVVVSVLSSVTSLGSIAKLRTIGLSSVFWLLLTNLLAILLTLGLALATGVGRGAQLELAGVDGDSLTGLLRPLDQVIVGLFPSNLANDLGANNLIGLILFAILIAVSYLLVADRKPEKVRAFKELVDATRRVFFKAVGFIIALTPYAVLALVASTTSTAVARLETATALLGVLVIALVACFVDAYLVNGVLVRVFADLNPFRFFRLITPPQYTAFTTQSSLGTLPLTIATLTRRVGVSPEVAGFTAPIGTTIGMPGCAGIWPTLVAVFSVQALGIQYTPLDYVVLVVLGLLVSLGTAGVPGTAIITATAVLTAVGLPIEVLVLLIPISAVAGTASTMANVTAAATASAIVARRAGALDDETFAGRRAVADDGDRDTVADPAAAAASAASTRRIDGPTSEGFAR